MTPETMDDRAVDALNRVFVDAVLGAGGIPLLLPAMGEPQLDAVLEVLDGLLLSGGGDVGPGRYGAEPLPEVAGVSEARDHWELLLADGARRRGLPTLGICRGAQLLNVAHGGTLVQHLPRHTDLAHRVADRPAEVVHDVVVDTTSRLAEVLGTVELGVNSLHHQAVEVVGDGLRPVAWAPDGTIEAVEGAGGSSLQEAACAAPSRWRPSAAEVVHDVAAGRRWPEAAAPEVQPPARPPSRSRPRARVTLRQPGAERPQLPGTLRRTPASTRAW